MYVSASNRKFNFKYIICYSLSKNGGNKAIRVKLKTPTKSTIIYDIIWI